MAYKIFTVRGRNIRHGAEVKLQSIGGALVPVIEVGYGQHVNAVLVELGLVNLNNLIKAYNKYGEKAAVDIYAVDVKMEANGVPVLIERELVNDLSKAVVVFYTTHGDKYNNEFSGGLNGFAFKVKPEYANDIVSFGGELREYYMQTEAVVFTDFLYRKYVSKRVGQWQERDVIGLFFKKQETYSQFPGSILCMGYVSYNNGMFGSEIVALVESGKVFRYAYNTTTKKRDYRYIYKNGKLEVKVIEKNADMWKEAFNNRITTVR